MNEYQQKADEFIGQIARFNLDAFQVDHQGARAAEDGEAVSKVLIRFAFKRDVKFPRFSMAQGEVWEVHGSPDNKRIKELTEVRQGRADRFEFAGGLCLSQDVEFIEKGDL
jgi:hypothetical protein